MMDWSLVIRHWSLVIWPSAFPLPPFALAPHPIVHLNALLNSVATLLLVAGLVLIKRGQVAAHKRTMLSAFAVSIAFLGCYLWYHYQVGSVRFTHPGPVRYVYYTILISHVLLAITVPVLASWTIYLGLRATGCCEKQAGDCPLFLTPSDATANDEMQEKGTVPLSKPQHEEGDSPLFPADNIRQGDAEGRKKGTVPELAAYRMRHRRMAHWTYPIWLYVSVTGVVVYEMLYHLWPPVGP
jgi:putative membrane protein